MAKAKKLKSGQWRTLVYSHTDESGKRHYESFTANTKKESEYLAAQFALDKKSKKAGVDKTLGDAMKEFLESRTNVISPSTLREYARMERRNFDNIKKVRLSKLNSQILQQWVNDFAATRSPKTVKNSWGFLSAVLHVYLPDTHISVHLPQAVPFAPNVPTNQGVVALICYYKERDRDMYIASCLAAFGSLRRSEIAPLTYGDIAGNCIRVHCAMVKNKNKEWVLKETNKNDTSNRIVPMPQIFIDELRSLQVGRRMSDRIIQANPGMISGRHIRAMKKLGIPPFRFHDLRHYTASVMHAIGIPDQYIMARGGWATDHTLKAIYRNTMADYMNEYTEIALDHFEQVHDGVYDQAYEGALTASRRVASKDIRCNTEYNTKK